jgi:hypothetical protein
MHVKTPRKVNTFFPVSDVWEATTRLRGFEVFSNIIKILRQVQGRKLLIASSATSETLWISGGETSEHYLM